MRYILATISLLAICVSVDAQCQNGKCYSGEAVQSKSKVTYAHGWYASDKCSKCIDLYWNGEFVGTLDPVRSVWQTNGKEHTVDLASTFGLVKTGSGLVSIPKPKDPPIPKECICAEGKCECKTCPEGCVASHVATANPDCGCGDCKCDFCKCKDGRIAAPGLDADKSNYGICKEWIPARFETYRLNGAEVNKSKAFAAIGDTGVPDDSKLQRVVIISDSADERRKVLEDFDSSPELAKYRGKLIVQAYSTDHWHVRDVGFVKTGRPTIYVQSPTGKVLHRQEDYAGGAPRLANALRKADPSYDPAKDPDLSKPVAPNTPVNPQPGPNVTPVTPDQSPLFKVVAGLAALVAAAVGAIYLMFFKK